MRKRPNFLPATWRFVWYLWFCRSCSWGCLAVLVAHSWGHEGPLSPQPGESGTWRFQKATKSASCKSWAFRSTEIFPLNMAFGRQWTELILEIYLLRLKVSIVDFHYTCRDFKPENIQVNFQDLKNFIQKSHTGYAHDETMGQRQRF